MDVGAVWVAAIAVVAAVIAKIRCYCRSDERGDCIQGCGFTDAQLLPETCAKTNAGAGVVLRH